MHAAVQTGDPDMRKRAIRHDVVGASHINRLRSVGRDLRRIGPFQLKNVLGGEQPQIIRRVILGLILSSSPLIAVALKPNARAMDTQSFFMKPPEDCEKCAKV